MGSQVHELAIRSDSATLPSNVMAMQSPQSTESDNGDPLDREHGREGLPGDKRAPGSMRVDLDIMIDTLTTFVMSMTNLADGVFLACSAARMSATWTCTLQLAHMHPATRMLHHFRLSYNGAPLWNF